MNTIKNNDGKGKGVNRRRFLAGAGASAISLAILEPKTVFGSEANSKIKLGLIGCGGRGTWIAKLFKDHGGYQVTAAADYFKDRVDAAGDELGVPAANRFTGLSGYKKLLETDVDAIAVESPPYFHPEHAAAGVAAGKHVYLAKPIAVDVPGCMTIEESGAKATKKNRCFLVDFQTRAHKAYQEAVKRVKEGMIGKMAIGEATYQCGPTWAHMNEILKKNPNDPELKLRAWGMDRVLSGDVITEQNIHAIDVASWFVGEQPLKAYGTGGEIRGFAGSCWDHFAVIFFYPNDITISFNSKQYGFGYDDILCRMYGTKGTVDTHYFGTVTIRSRDESYNGGRLNNLYTNGVVNNIATFHDDIKNGNYSNPTVKPSVRSNLTTILGRTAAYKNSEVTWDEMIKANRKLEYDMSGLKV
ncbi:MAG: Gfo/Idh/MocA family oxidoreductase [Verrucomicrobia bacterium]|nr:Gfo/Idh/MocA family oxidoreductase [Verrucomicrobiota bacterium]MCF7708318.1 Gfo/Idh/MocA family oxidoreductase [Verrucomicrobiota bacterium]